MIGGQRARAKESLAAYLIRTIFLPIAGYKRLMRDVEKFAASISRQRSTGDAPPPNKLQKRFTISSQQIAGSNVYFVEPKTGRSLKTVIYLHGGAYVGNMQALQWKIVEALVERTSARVVVPGYPLAPEQNWRDGYAMIASLYEHLMEQTDPSNIVLTGDSAGAGLALGFAQALRDERRPVPARLVLFSPWLDLRYENAEQEALESVDPILARPALNYGADRWAAGTPLDDPHISPGLGSLRDLPPMLVFSGTADLLNADARALVKSGMRDGASIQYVEGRNMTHAWSISPIPEAKIIYDQAAAFIIDTKPESRKSI